jgi:AcrR family transcriptional regulator
MAAARPNAAIAERTPRGRGDLLRGRLLDAGIELVSELGDESHVTIRAVTKRAGVSPTAFYLHFQTRDELVSALRDRGFEAFRSTVAQGAAAGGEDPVARLRGAGLAYMRFARERPNVYALIFSPVDPVDDEDPKLHDGAGLASFMDLMGLIQAYLDHAGASKADVQRLAMGIWTGLHGYVTLRYPSPSKKMDWPTDEEFTAGLSEAWLGPAVRGEGG